MTLTAPTLAESGSPVAGARRSNTALGNGLSHRTSSSEGLARKEDRKKPARDANARKALTAEDLTFTIGEIARDFGVSLRTLRFYEDRKLLKPRRDGAMRIYDGADRARLATILRGKALGFTLTEIQSLIAAEESGAAEPALKLNPELIRSQIAHLRRQRDDIDTAIAELEAALPAE